MKLTFLGTGTSFGIPQIGCDCEVCLSADPRNMRTRASAYLEIDGRGILIDTPPDLRTQVLREGIRRVDAVLVTHPHADHLHGIDDLRAFSRRHGAVPMFASPETAAVIRHNFGYIFAGPSEDTLPQIDLEEVTGPFVAAGVEVVPVPIMHAEDCILGYRIGGLAYLTDCSDIPEASWPLLEGLDVLVIGALRHRPHRRHMTVAQALSVVRRLEPKRTLFTHMTHELDHATLGEQLDDDVQPAWDGLTVEVPTGGSTRPQPGPTP